MRASIKREAAKIADETGLPVLTDGKEFFVVRPSPSLFKKNKEVIDTSYAESLGKEAHKAGLTNVPAQDLALWELTKGRKVGDKRTIPELKAWIKGWTKEHIAVADKELEKINTNPSNPPLKDAIWLQGIGYFHAIPAKNLKPGMVTVWNYGETQKVIQIELKGKWVLVTEESPKTGKQYITKRKPDRLIAVEQKREIVGINPYTQSINKRYAYKNPEVKTMDYIVPKEQIKHDFKVEVIETDFSVDFKLDGVNSFYDKDKSILQTLKPLTVGKQTVNGITIPDSIKRDIELARMRVKERNDQDKINRELDRPAPYINKGDKVIYKVGIDTGKIYSDFPEKVIEAVLKTTQPEPIFSGERDSTRKYPHTHDSDIPVNFVQGGKAKGYSSVWTEDVFALPASKVHQELQKYEDQVKKIKEFKAAKLAEIYAKAKSTGVKQIVNQWSEECHDKEESCDIDNIIEFAMPDGTTKTERHHTW